MHFGDRSVYDVRMCTEAVDHFTGVSLANLLGSGTAAINNHCCLLGEILLCRAGYMLCHAYLVYKAAQSKN